MKIFQINGVCGFGSTGKIAVDIANKAIKQGNEVCIAYGRGNYVGDLDTYRIGSKIESATHAFLSRITDKQGLYSIKATYQLIAKIKDFSPDLIQLHNLHGYYLNYPLLFQFLKEYQKPVVWTLHDCWAFTGHCAHFQMVSCDKWKTHCERCPLKHEYPTSFILDSSMSNFNTKREMFTDISNMHIVTPSIWLKQQVEQSFLKKYPIQVINNGIDFNTFHYIKNAIKEKYHIAHKKIVLAAANIWTDAKGLSDLQKLQYTLSDGVVLMIIGLKDKQKRSFHESVICIPRIENAEEMAMYYSVADVFINLSYGETMGLTTVEALACGTPAIVYDNTAIPEPINTYNGKTVITGDIASVKREIDYLIEHSPSREECIQSARKYDKKQAYEKYLNKYKSLV